LETLIVTEKPGLKAGLLSLMILERGRGAGREIKKRLWSVQS
jgi:hypothetical protein